MEHSYDVRVWSPQAYKGKRGVSYRQRWVVGPKTFTKSFPTRAQADSFRVELVAAQRQGAAFELASGLPVSMVRRNASGITWYEFACRYVDYRWPGISPKHRKGIAEALGTVTVALMRSPVDATTAKAMRSALLNWGLNKRRGSPEQPPRVTRILATIARNSKPLSDLSNPVVVRAVLDAVSTKVDGSKASHRTANWKRSILSTALAYAVEQGLLETNLVTTMKLRRQRTSSAVDRRSVINPEQAEALLKAVAVTPTSGHLLVGFFACMYYSALRPEEATELCLRNLDLPAEGWGWILLEGSAPEVDKQWTDSGRRREARELKHRARGEHRRVPCPPPLVAILRDHLREHGTDQQGRLFRGVRGGPLAGVTYTRIWARAREAALTPEQVDSPLARRPYDLRHAAVSTWLNSGVAPTQVADWAGHSVEVLLRVYAKCLDGGEEMAMRRIDAALGRRPEV